MFGLVVGKPIGVVGTSYAMARFTRARLSVDIEWADVAAIGLLSGIGFTVSLLIAELAFANNPVMLSAAKLAVLAASVLSAMLASIAILLRNRHYRKTSLLEEEAYTTELRAITGEGPPPRI
jgi:Na+:H+ antiporter, NhaA family